MIYRLFLDNSSFSQLYKYICYKVRVIRILDWPIELPAIGIKPSVSRGTTTFNRGNTVRQPSKSIMQFRLASCMPATVVMCMLFALACQSSPIYELSPEYIPFPADQTSIAFG